MVCVIFGHIPLLDGLLDVGLPESYDALTSYTMRGIYAFHMPLFVLISGYFTRRKPIGKQFSGSLRLLRLFLVFQLVDLAILYFVGNEQVSIRRIVSPRFALWYLVCLFYWRMLLSVIPQSWSPKWIVGASFIASLAVGFTPIGFEMGLHRFFSFMPYFMIGHYYGSEILHHIENKVISTPPQCKIILILLLLCVTVIASLNPHWLDVIIQPYNGLIVFPLRIAFLCYSLLLSYLLVFAFSLNKKWEGSRMAEAGSDTLFFYLLHPYVLYCIVRLWGLFGDTIDILDACMIAALTVVVLFGMEKIKTIHLLVK